MPPTDIYGVEYTQAEWAMKQLRESLMDVSTGSEDYLYGTEHVADAIEALVDAKVRQAIGEAINGLQANGYIPV